MTEKIVRRGVKTPNSYEPDILDGITVAQVITDHGMIISDDNNIKEVREWLNQEQDFKSNYFIISSSEGEYRGILSSSNLFSNHHSLEIPIGNLVKRNEVYIQQHDTLRAAVETMAKENVDVLPVISKGANIIGILSYHDIIATYKQGIEEHEKKEPHISLKRNGLKILLHGKRFVSARKEKDQS